MSAEEVGVDLSSGLTAAFILKYLALVGDVLGAADLDAPRNSSNTL